jgi:cation diffusion facilitator family transporter
MDSVKKTEKFGPLTNLLLRLWGPKPDANNTERRAIYALIEGYVSVVINSVLFVFKLWLGWWSGSIALIADAAHTFADSLTSIIVIVSARVARRPADAEHPFGHGRVEAVATVACAVLLAVAGIEFGKASIERVLHPTPLTASWLVMALVAATMVIKEWLARLARVLGRATNNPTLEAEFWHHRSDVFATALVVVGMVGGRYGWSVLDGIMGGAISVLLLKVAYDIARSAIDSLLGQAPTAEEIESLRQVALSIEGVRGVHDIVVHRYGETRFVSLHVETADHLSAAELHTLAEQVEDRVEEGRHGSVCVHVDPVNANHPAYESVLQAVTTAVGQDPCAASFHDVRVVGGSDSFTVKFDVNLKSDCLQQEAETQERLQQVVLAACRAVQVVVRIEPPYSYQTSEQ